jgi:hypothetical protein
MKKLLGIIVLGLLWVGNANAREYCFPINEQNKILDIRTDSSVHLIFLGEELKCIGKTKEAKIYLDKYNENIKVWVQEIVPMYPKGSKNRFKICGQIHLNDDKDNLSNPIKANKYHQCEEERIKKAEEKRITYLYDLFYELEK